MKTNPVRWFEIYVQDMARAQAFYEAVLETKLESLGNSDDSAVELRAFPMDMETPGAAGALARMEGCPPGGNGTLVYFKCNDCALEARRVVAAGGRMQREKTAIGEYGFIALAFDTEGNLFGLHSMK